jgi:hypothetical protein
MAKLEDRGQRGLPPPPAPTRRGANPWRFSQTARKQEPPPRAAQETDAERLLEELFGGKPAEATPAQATPARAHPAPASTPVLAPPEQRNRHPIRSKRRSSFWPLLVLLLIGGVLVKLVSDAQLSGEWRKLIPALFAFLFIAHGWWRSRQRKDEKEGEGQDER